MSNTYHEYRSKRAGDLRESLLREATLDVQALFAGLSPYRLDFNAADDAGQQGGLTSVYQDRRQRGENIPVYQSWQELKRIRDRSRVLCYFNEFALCGITNRVNYVVGDGFTYKAVPADCENATARKLADKTQKYIDIWQEVNDLQDMEAEALWRLDEDGEFLVRRFTDRKGIDHLRFIEPEQLQSPEGDSNPAVSFGVESKPDDVETVKAYWIKEDPLSPKLSRVDAFDIAHSTANVKRSSKRGLPTYFPVEMNLRRCEDLLASMTHMAKTRAKVALVRKLTGVSGESAQRLLDRLTNVKASDPTTGDSINIERLLWGQILTIGGNQELTALNPSLGASDLVEVLQAELRAVASRLNMPEWMFTALADAKYSNAFVVEAPTLKSFKRLQHRLTRRFGSGRHGHRAGLAWRQVQELVYRDKLPAETLRLVRIECTGPSLETRDKDKEASTAETLTRSKLVSFKTARQNLGYDPEEEAKQVAAESVGTLRPIQDLTGFIQLQTAYTVGQVSRAAACAAAEFVLGFTREQTEVLFSVDKAVDRTQQQQGGGDADGSAGLGADGDGPGMSGSGD